MVAGHVRSFIAMFLVHKVLIKFDDRAVNRAARLRTPRPQCFVLLEQCHELQRRSEGNVDENIKRSITLHYERSQFGCE
jgi:hypothetical protein